VIVDRIAASCHRPNTTVRVPHLQAIERVCMETVINWVIVALIAGMTWALMSEGLWGAALMFFNVLFAGLLAFNFYEPLAALLDGTGIGWGFSDTLCLMGIFIVALVILRLTTETIAPAMVRFPTPIYHIGRIFFGLLTSLLTVALLLVAFETAPVHKKIFGVIDYKSEVPFGLGLDRQWLGFFQYTTGLVFVSHNPGTLDPFREYRDANVFDPRAEWLLLHQEARPYGNESVLAEDQGGGGGAAAGAQGGGAAPAGGGGGAVLPRPGGVVVVPY
jgi:hypothetical protein